MFRLSESALGVAASELFDALPNAHRERLAELPVASPTLSAS